MENKRSWMFGMVSGMMGALVASYLFRSPAPVSAEESGYPQLVGESAEFADPSGRIYARFRKEGGQSAKLSFFNTQGQALLELGLDPTGLPEIRLMSQKNNPNPKLVLRLAGTNESAQIVFRDNKNKDRMLMGLDPAKNTEDPYLVYYDKDGKKKTVFGDYQ